MAIGKISRRTINQLMPPPSGKVFVWDSALKGFGFYVTQTGKRGYVLQYRMGGRSSPCRRYTIGRHGSPWTPETARKRALALLYKISVGIDPIIEERNAKATAEIDERLRFNTYIEYYREKHIERRKLRSADALMAALRDDLLPHFHDVPITDITRNDVSRVIDHLSKRSSGAANRAFTTLRSMLNFAVSEGDISSSPMAGQSKPHAFAKRKRFLEDWEIKRLCEAIYDLGGTAKPIEMLLLTGQRLREAFEATWAEFDFHHLNWVIPGERTKNKLDHLLPITPNLLRFLDELCPSQERRSGLLFPCTNGKPFRRYYDLKLDLDAAIARRVALAKQAGLSNEDRIEHFRFHDLRRTLATGMQRLGVEISHTEAVLNHTSGTRGGLVSVYQLHEYRPEKAAALTLWQEHIAALLGKTDAWPGGRDLAPLPDLRIRPKV